MGGGLMDTAGMAQMWNKMAFKKNAIKLKEAWEYPGVAVFTLSYSALKVVIFSLALWLPYYITETYDTSNTNAIRYAAFFDFGSIIGGVVLGLVVDQLQYKSLVLTIGVLLSAGLCAIFCLLAYTELEVAVILTLIGVFLGGCNNLLFGPIRMELGLKMKVKRHLEVNETLSTVSGLMEGVATVAAAFSQLAVPLLKHNDNWFGITMFLLAMLLTSVVVIIGPTIEDIGALRTRYKQHRQTADASDVDSIAD